MRTSLFTVLLLAAPALADTGKTMDKLEVTSSAFSDNQPIPTEFTCQGAEVSPPLHWSGVPAATKSIAILVEDPDAPKGTFTHWIVTNLSPTTMMVDKGAALPDGAMAGKNDKGKAGYAGPCPPSGTHHYHFRVYALDRMLPKTVTSKAAFTSAIAGHVLAQGELVGTYTKDQKKTP